MQIYQLNSTNLKAGKRKLSKKKIAVFDAYSVKKTPETITEGYFDDSSIRVRVLIYYNFGRRNCIGDVRAPILLIGKI